MDFPGLILDATVVSDPHRQLLGEEGRLLLTGGDLLVVASAQPIIWHFPTTS